MAILKIFDEEDNKWKVVVTGRDGKDGEDGQELDHDDFLNWLNSSSSAVNSNIDLIGQYLENLRQEIVNKGVSLSSGSALVEYNGAIQELIIKGSDMGFNIKDKLPTSLAERDTYAGLGIHDYTRDLVLPEFQGGTLVTTIGEEAFMNYGLTKLDLPDNITTIGKNAFKNNKIRSFRVEGPGYNSPGSNEGLQFIEDGAFENNEISDFFMKEETVKSIGDNAFRGNSFWYSIYIPTSVETIGHNAFTDIHLNRKVDVSIGPNTTYEDDSFPDNSTLTIRRW